MEYVILVAEKGKLAEMDKGSSNFYSKVLCVLSIHIVLAKAQLLVKLDINRVGMDASVMEGFCKSPDSGEHVQCFYREEEISKQLETVM